MIKTVPDITDRASNLNDRGFKWAHYLVLTCLLLFPDLGMAQSKTSQEATSRLFESIAENNLQGVKINLIGGADLRARNAQNKTPIEMAIDRGHSDIVFYLMAYRDTANKVTSSKTIKTPARTAKPVLPAPGNSQSAVSGVYTPPSGAAPWSATVVTSEPPAPEPKFQEPSPFEPGSRAPGSGLRIIGDIRGPSGLEPAPEPAAPVIPLSQVKTTAPPPAPALASVQAIPSAPTVIPLHKPQPPKDMLVAIQDTPSPLFDDAITPLKPAAEPVVRAVRQPVPPAAVELVSNTVTPPAPVQEIRIRTAPLQQPPPERKQLPVKTALPGKPREDSGFFDMIMQALSLDQDQTLPKQDAKNRIVMDLPPPLTSDRKPDQIIEDSGGWEVKKIETASPAPSIERAAQPKPDMTRKLAVSPMTNIDLSLLNDHKLGLAPPNTESADSKKSCITKKSGSLIFCIVDFQWPADIAHLFAASSVLYEGTKAIVRYDEGAATYYHTLFPSQSFGEIVRHYTARYGPPTKTVDRSIAPLASPRLSNPTVIWRSIAPVTKLLTTLEIRTFDDTRGGFPDTRRGVALLYHEWSRPIFPHVSTVELMMLGANRQH